MRSLKQILSIAALCFGATAFSQNIGLYFSEYAEGSSNHKYLEIYNGTGASVDMGNFSLSTCSNGCDVFGQLDFPNNLTFPMGSILLPGEVFIIAHPSADPSILAVADITFSFLSNGDDAMVLTFAGATATNFEIVDIIGDLQGDPGASWSVDGTGTTVNQTLVRKPEICFGNPNGLGSFGPDPASAEWSVLPQDTWTNLGGHTSTCTDCSTTFGNISPISCDDYTSPSTNHVYTTSGMYRDTVTSMISATCDSIIFIDLTINSPYNTTASATICDGASYTFGTQTLTTAGTYTEVFEAANTCDSTVELTLSVVTTFTTNLVETICQGESITIGPNTYSTTGIYSTTIPSSLGCDSTINLDLTVNPTYSNNITAIDCGNYVSPSGMYTWTSTGIYNDTLSTVNGCDSVLVIDLTINDTNLMIFNVSACDSYMFEGNPYTATGTYDVVYPNAAMCDSTLRLNLIITNSPAAPTTSGDQEMCDGETPVDVTIPTSSGASLIITGVLDGPLPGGVPKMVEFYAIDDIADLSVYGFGSANNGLGTNGIEFTFPSVSLNSGEFYYVGTDSTNFNAYFGFFPYASHPSAGNVNGDDAIELFQNTTVIDVFGEINVDGTGQPWEYLDGWATRNSNSQPNFGVFNIAEWSFSGVDALDGSSTNAGSGNPYPVGTFTTTSQMADYTWYSDAGLTNQIATGNTYTPSISSPGTEEVFVVATVNGCSSASSSVEIVINALPTVSYTDITDICVYNNAFTLAAGTPVGGSYTGTGVSGTTFDPSAAGVGAAVVTYTYTDGNGCANSAQSTINVNACAGITDPDLSNSLSAYPNPTKGTVKVSGLALDGGKLYVRDLGGKVILMLDYPSESVTIDCSAIEAGTYFIQDERSSQVLRLIVQ